VIDMKDSDYISHHGIKGQKWGVRRFQNEDGSLTTAGKARYSKEQYRRDKAVYGRSAAKRIEKRVNKKGLSVSEARSREASKINSARKFALVSGQAGAAVGGIGGAVGGFVASTMVTRAIARSGNPVLSDPSVQLAIATTVSAGTGSAAKTLGRYGGQSLGMALAGYSPSKYR
jgi:hypothetical protein